MTADVGASSLLLKSIVNPEGNDRAWCVEIEAVREYVALSEEDTAIGNGNSAIRTAYGDRSEFCPIHVEGIEIWVLRGLEVDHPIGDSHAVGK